MDLRVLVPLRTYPDDVDIHVADQVAAWAQHLSAHVSALVLEPEFPDVRSLLGNFTLDIPGMIVEAKARSNMRLQEFIRLLKGKLNEPALFEVIKLECNPDLFGGFASIEARYYDLTVLPLGDANYISRNTAETIIFGSGRPTVLLPQKWSRNSLENVVIAWDGSRAAARAVGDAGELLRRAARVTVATVRGEKPLAEDAIGERLVNYLSFHKIPAVISEVRPDGREIGETLQSHAEECGAGLLVMGAFGHSRMMEFILGGATRQVIQKLRLPTLLSH